MCNFTQVHAHEQIMGDKLAFLHTLSKYRITQTFVPNAFLGMVENAVKNANPQELARLDLSSLHCIFTGGEATAVDTAKSFLECLGGYGLSGNCIFPCFGMTETCAGCMFNAKFPSIDEGHKFASVGTCCPDLDIRIVNEQGAVVGACEEGELQLSGRIVFIGYYKNEKANMEAFVEENGVRWFKTGDKGKMVDDELRLTGRSKDTININGNQYFSHEIEAAIDRLEFILRSVCISVRAPNTDTEQLVIFFVPVEPHTISVPKNGCHSCF